jgi:hypothetical protein
MQGVLQSEDLLTLLALVACDGDAAAAQARLHVTEAAFEASLQRCARAELFAPIGRRVRRTDLSRFLIHGVRHVFPGEVGQRPTLGVPTSLSAPPLRASFVVSPGAEVVWAHPQGTVEGLPLTPLEPSLPELAAEWPALHELAALVDAVRAGRSRERQAAASVLTRTLAA